MRDTPLGGLLTGTSRNAILAWLVTLLLCVLALVHALNGSYRWVVFTGVTVTIVIVPAVTFRDPRVMPPGVLLLVVALPVINAAVFGRSFLTAITVYVAVAAVALVVAVEIHRFTPARMNHTFAVGLVVIATLAVAATWNVAQWVCDLTLGTSYIIGGRSQDTANHGMMIDFAYAMVAGLFTGIVFDRYFRLQTESDRATARTTARSDTPVPAPPEDERTAVPSLVRDRLNVSESHVRTISRVMQAALGGLLLYGILTRNPTTIVNAGLALGITFLPALLEHDYRLPLEPELVFWITTAVFLHSLGSAGLYDLIDLWDTLTHTLSATIVAAAGYAVVRAIDLHTDEIYLPPELIFVFILLFVLAFGVIWELGEFALDLSAQRFGIEAVLSQHGINDTIGDLVFDFVGAVTVAIWGTVYLTDISHRIADRLGR